MQNTTTAHSVSKPTRVMSIFSTSGWRSALVQEGRKYLHIITFDVPLRVQKVHKVGEKHMYELDYPLKRAINKYRKYGRKHGITDGARKFLRRSIKPDA